VTIKQKCEAVRRFRRGQDIEDITEWLWHQPLPFSRKYEYSHIDVESTLRAFINGKFTMDQKKAKKSHD
jgi:hypothetical protein